MQAEHIKREVALKCRNAHGLDCVPEFLERFSSSFHRRRDLAVERTKAGLPNQRTRSGRLLELPIPLSNEVALLE
jgi:hypothetical protein